MFYDEFLSKYETNHVGTHNCAWVTQEFTKWANSKGIKAQAIYFVWPDKPNNSGEAHIAPVVDNTILDFTFKQFDNQFKDYAKITPINDWKKVYSKYGYGENTVEVNGKPETVLISTFNDLKDMKEIGGITTIHPSNLINK